VEEVYHDAVVDSLYSPVDFLFSLRAGSYVYTPFFDGASNAEKYATAVYTYTSTIFGFVADIPHFLFLFTHCLWRHELLNEICCYDLVVMSTVIWTFCSIV
jgi:hypothetical protein